VSEVAKALALPAEFEWRGKQFKLSPVTLEIEAYFAAALERRTAEGLARNREALGEDVYADAVRQFNDDVTCGEYEWGGRVGAKARASAAGTRELVFLCLAECQNGFTRAQLSDLFREPPPDGKTPSKWQEVVGLLRKLLDVPKNGQGPAGSALAGPPGEPPT
jgi:hypothetical protein